MTFGSISGNFLYRHHVQSRNKLHVPNEGAFLVSEAKTITIIFEESRTGLTIGHVHESRIVSKTTSMHWRCWAGEFDTGCLAAKSHWRRLESWRWPAAIRIVDRFYPVLNIERKKLQMDTRCPEGGWQKVQVTTRPEYLWPDVWSNLLKTLSKGTEAGRLEGKDRSEELEEVHISFGLHIFQHDHCFFFIRHSTHLTS